MPKRHAIIYTGIPPSGTGIQLTKVRPTGSQPYNVWFGGAIIRFCANVETAFTVLKHARGTR